MPLKASLLALLVIFIWGSNFVAIKIGVAEIPPLILLALRFTFAGLFFLPFMKWPGWRQARMIVLVGILMGLLHQGLLYFGLQIMPAGLMSILLQSQLIMVTLIGYFFLKEQIRWRTWTGITIGIIGIVVLIGLPDTSAPLPVAGYIIGLLSAFFIALAYIAMKKIDVVHPPTYIALMHLPLAPPIFISSLLVDGTDWFSHAPDLNWTIIATVVLYQSVILSLTHILWQKLMVQYPVSQIIPWTLLIPVFGIGCAVALLGEELTISIVAGTLITILGLGIITLRKIQKHEI